MWKIREKRRTREKIRLREIRRDVVDFRERRFAVQKKSTSGLISLTVLSHFIIWFYRGHVNDQLSRLTVTFRFRFGVLLLRGVQDAHDQHYDENYTDNHHENTLEDRETTVPNSQGFHTGKFVVDLFT